jgi:hypothetical protein
MKVVTFEWENYAPPSNNEIRHMNSFVYRRLVKMLRESIVVQHGEGPWPKVVFKKGDYPAHVRAKVIEDVKKTWKPKRKVFAEFLIRRKRRFDGDNNHGGFKPLIDAIARSGWLVDDFVKWFEIVSIIQTNGDPKSIVTLHIPEDHLEEAALEERMKRLNEQRRLSNCSTGCR